MYEKVDTKNFNPYSTGIDFSRQNLTSVESKVDPGTVRVKSLLFTVDP